MGLITVDVWDATGNKKRTVEMPDDAPLKRILAVLIERMSFPQHGPDGQLLSYKCQHRTTGKQLLDDQTLADAGVKEGDVLRLLPEITAGGKIKDQKPKTKLRLGFGLWALDFGL
jgi:uncharacterized ubiquitin-like protein YukD